MLSGVGIDETMKHGRELDFAQQFVGDTVVDMAPSEFVELEMGFAFPGAQIGLCKAAAFLEPFGQDIVHLAFIHVGVRCIGIQHGREVDDIPDVFQVHGYPRGMSFGHCRVETEGLDSFRVHHGRFDLTYGRHMGDFVGLDGHVSDGAENLDIVDLIFHAGVPVDGFQKSLRSRWGDDIVADTFHSVFGTREQREMAPYFNGSLHLCRPFFCRESFVIWRFRFAYL